ncbi:uncharacterized protein C8Q71DRAFT_772337 [Rhodofomes roseus]|uniref:Secreted protein n=1 Tax=Rhodofomes roseus TaxID=34475 RepID=A0ABQ8K903_9APHY|nr:uncharacterized protein C8Q71DRAFT_772337 [Rhodofomes roseus]KAH9833755.1 hypothetical protein C8Q71DRAFT_772337 [Rhodofomes roseus]
MTSNGARNVSSELLLCQVLLLHRIRCYLWLLPLYPEAIASSPSSSFDGSYNRYLDPRRTFAVQPSVSCQQSRKIWNGRLVSRVVLATEWTRNNGSGCSLLGPIERRRFLDIPWQPVVYLDRRLMKNPIGRAMLTFGPSFVGCTTASAVPIRP